VGLAGEVFARAGALSGGQQQRVAVARALVQEASLILADEPVASVDVRTAETVLDVLRELHQQGKTVVMSLHQVDFALAYCSRLLGLNGGRLVYDGPPAGIEGSQIYRTEEEVRDDARRAAAFERALFEPRA
jgi:phosphonate transport system ATP-binding protein